MLYWVDYCLTIADKFVKWMNLTTNKTISMQTRLSNFNGTSVKPHSQVNFPERMYHYISWNNTERENLQKTEWLAVGNPYIKLQLESMSEQKTIEFCADPNKTNHDPLGRKKYTNNLSLPSSSALVIWSSSVRSCNRAHILCTKSFLRACNERRELQASLNPQWMLMKHLLRLPLAEKTLRRENSPKWNNYWSL